MLMKSRKYFFTNNLVANAFSKNAPWTNLLTPDLSDNTIVLKGAFKRVKWKQLEQPSLVDRRKA